MKNGWKIVPMGKLCSISSGESDTQDAVADGPYAFFDRSKTIKRSSRFLYDCEALIIPGEGKEFLPKHFEGKFDLHQRAYALFDFLPELDVRFLYHLLHHRSDYFPSVAVGATVKSLRRRHFEDLPVPVPPLAEQQRIVGLLDEAFEGLATAKANAEKNLQNARALFQSVLSQSVIGETTKGWRESGGAGKTSAASDLKELFRQIAATDRKSARGEETAGHEIITDALPEEWRHASIEQLFNLIDYRGKTASKSDTGHRLITARNIRMGFISEEPVTFISKEQYKKWMVRGFPKPGDIFFVTEGHTMGFVALNNRTDEFALAQRTITLQPPVPFSTKFFFYFMLSPHFQKPVKLNATGAAAVGMKASKFRSLPLAFPSFTEQEIIADKLDELSEETQRLARLYERKHAALEALKKSLLHQAFSGEL